MKGVRIAWCFDVSLLNNNSMSANKESAHQQLLAKRGLFTQIGLCLSLILVISAFEWRTEMKIVQLDFDHSIAEQIFTETEVKVIPQQKPPAPKPKAISLEISDEPKTETVPELFKQDQLEEPDFWENAEGLAEETTDETPDYRLYSAEFKGGTEAFYNYVKKNLLYPEKLKRLGISGTVLLSYVVNEEGKVTDVKVIRSVNETLDREAVKVLENSPHWLPATMAGKSVKMRMQIPISFVLEN